MLTLPDLLRWRASHQPNRLACRFLTDGESAEVTMTYGDLDHRVRAIAGTLQANAHIRDRVLLVFPPGLDFITAYLGCLYAGMVAVIVHPPHLARLPPFLSRMGRITTDATPSVALTTGVILDQLATAIAATDELRSVRWVSTDREPLPDAEAWRDPAITGGDLAFLQYTSGSTSDPKGVMVSHENLMHNLHLIQQSFALAGDVSTITWLPPYHDMGLIGGILAPLHLGYTVTLMSPLAFIQRPRRWLQAISRFQGGVSGGPSFAYDLCVRKITPQQKANLDLSHWEVAFNGAEPIDVEAMRTFAECFEPCGFDPRAFKPCYGLAEATLMVSSIANATRPLIRSFGKQDLTRDVVVPRPTDSHDARALVSCGRPAARTTIVDPVALTEVPPSHIGEIWIAGPSIAMGYWNRSAESEATFQAHVADTGSGPFLRTGDLGFLLDGELFVTGRLKDLIIIDGQNHYPQDIEKTVGECLLHRGVAECAAFSIARSGQEELIVVAATHGRSDRAVDEVERSIRAAVSEHHDVRVRDIALVKAGWIPRTPSGKIRRHACRAKYLSGTLEVREAS